MPEEVVLVDEQDKAIGVAGKQQAHLQGSLHRAFSIFVFNLAGELLLQKRADGKYHSGGLWSNSCCGHPRPGEQLIDAVHRRLSEEMGFDCELNKAFDFVYKAQLENSLIEHEFDHVFIGVFSGQPKLNSEEAQSFEWLALDELASLLSAEPDRFTYWLKQIFEPLSAYLTKNPLNTGSTARKSYRETANQKTGQATENFSV